ncbi:hypothetical protein DERF_001588 [Dermatophagoides farinae]|uniref:Uncharacterized protein n=1 Tax=Dermatophagoides farinae TaxID=6954 RepID=A0A922ICJ7_DERFA|nr:hypothetical protein DERF_001588 [Dermatophagoides farinae]
MMLWLEKNSFRKNSFSWFFKSSLIGENSDDDDDDDGRGCLIWIEQQQRQQKFTTLTHSKSSSLSLSSTMIRFNQLFSDEYIHCYYYINSMITRIFFFI